MSYEHLTLEQRYQIAARHSAGSSNKCIAEEIGCHPSTIGREPRRNCCEKAVYVGSIAHGQAKTRRRIASARSHLPESVRAELIERLMQNHSPEQIRGRLALLKAGQVSHTTVYRYARRPGLRHHLRHPKRRRVAALPRVARTMAEWECGFWCGAAHCAQRYCESEPEVRLQL